MAAALDALHDVVAELAVRQEREWHAMLVLIDGLRAEAVRAESRHSLAEPAHLIVPVTRAPAGRA